MAITPISSPSGGKLVSASGSIIEGGGVRPRIFTKNDLLFKPIYLLYTLKYYSGGNYYGCGQARRRLDASTINNILDSNFPSHSWRSSDGEAFFDISFYDSWVASYLQDFAWLDNGFTVSINDPMNFNISFYWEAWGVK